MIDALTAVVVGAVFLIGLTHWWSWMERVVTTRGRR
jgi:hypothetical protein